jgi:hypothetical protein
VEGRLNGWGNTRGQQWKTGRRKTNEEKMREKKNTSGKSMLRRKGKRK